MMDAKKRLMEILGLHESDFKTNKPVSERIDEVEVQTNNALTELADLQGETEITLSDVSNALIEIAEMIAEIGE